MKDAVIEIPLSLDYSKYKAEKAGKKLNADHLVHLIENNVLCKYILMYRPKLANEDIYINDPSRDIIVGELVDYIEQDDKQICKIRLKDSLYYSKLNDPVIRPIGLMSEENNVYTVTKIIKLELGERIKVPK